MAGHIQASNKTNTCETPDTGLFSATSDPFQWCLKNEHSLSSIDALLRDRNSRRTFQLLSRVIESRVPLDWIPPYLEYRRQKSASGSDDAQTPDSTDEHHLHNHQPPYHEEIEAPTATTTPTTATTSAAPSFVSAFFSTFQHQLYHMPLPPESIRGSTQSTAVDLVNTFEERYSENFKSLVADALRVYRASQSTSDSSQSASGASSSEDNEIDFSPDGCYSQPDARTRYIGILHSLFVQQINWGRIVAMMSFLRALCEVLNSSATAMPVTETAATASIDTPDYVAPPREVAEAAVVTSPDPVAQQRKLAALQYLIWTVEFIHKDSKLAEWIEAHGSWEGLESMGKSTLSTQFASILVGASLFLLVLRRFWSR